MIPGCACSVHAIERDKSSTFRCDTVILDAPTTGHALSLLGLPVRRVVLNAVAEGRFSTGELDDLLRNDLVNVADPLLRAARFALHRRALEEEQRRRLASLVNLPTVDLPLICQGRLRRPCIEKLADVLEATGG